MHNYCNGFYGSTNWNLAHLRFLTSAPFGVSD